MLYAFVLVAFIKLLFLTESPRLVAGLYTAVAAIGAVMGVAGGKVGLFAALIWLVLCGAFAFAYFWILLWLKPRTGIWWSVVVGGALLMVIL